MNTWAGKIAVVTGASAGIGAEVTLDLAKAGMHVVGLARRKERVDALAEKATNFSGKIYSFQCDVSNTESIVKAFQWIKEKFGKIHVLINNAGRLKYGPTLSEDIPHEEYLSTIDTNLSGLVVCTREAYRLMKIHEEPGYIININSIAGHVTASAMMVPANVYPVSKHGVTFHTESVRLELATAGIKRIRVTSLSPGRVKTEITEAAGVKMPENTPDFEELHTKDISDAIIYLLSLPEHVNITELTIKPTGELF